MRRISITLITMVAVAVSTVNAASSLTQEDFFYTNFEDVLASADDLTDGVEKAYYYVIQDLNHDGKLELVVADINKTCCVFNVVDGEVHLISPDYTVNSDTLNWQPINSFYINTATNRSHDITLRHHPLFAYDIDIAANRFTVPGDVTADEQIMLTTVYNRMIFKPHIGNIHLVKAEKGSYKIDGQDFDLGMCYTFALDNRQFTGKMFRGYSNEAAVPLIVPDTWLSDHNPLQFSRWMSGEARPAVSAGVRKLIEQYFGGNDRIKQIHWLASCQVNERSFYQVLFEPRNGRVLTSLVCVAEGQVVSTRNSWFDIDPADNTSTDIGLSIDELMWFEPEIMVMAATEKGLELYVRWSSLEGTHFSIWREVADQFITVQDDYHYIMAY